MAVLMCWLAFLVLTMSNVLTSEGADLDIPEFVPIQQESALKQENNLRSKTYQDFIHTLYRFDNDNLKKVDSLFSTVDRSSPTYSSNWEDFDTPELVRVAGTEVAAPEIPEIRSNRQKRDIIFRPLFVYREYQHEQENRRKRQDPENQKKSEVAPSIYQPYNTYSSL